MAVCSRPHASVELPVGEGGVIREGTARMEEIMTMVDGGVKEGAVHRHGGMGHEGGGSELVAMVWGIGDGVGEE